jgi:hypothetical protein
VLEIGARLFGPPVLSELILMIGFRLSCTSTYPLKFVYARKLGLGMLTPYIPLGLATEILLAVSNS